MQGAGPLVRRARRVFAIAAAFALVGAASAGAVILDNESRITITLDDGTTVTLYAEDAGSPSPPPPATGAALRTRVLVRARPHVLLAAGASAPAAARRYYYLPTNLRLATRPDGTPEFLFLKFTTEQRADQGGVSGAVMHFLVLWGLTAEQEKELAAKLAAQIRGAKLGGAVPLEETSDNSSFQVVSATLGDKTMATNLVTSGKAPLLPGGRAAAAARLTAEGAQLLASTFEKTRSITDLSLAMNFGYQTLLPAAKGTATLNWKKLQEERDKLTAEYKRTRTGTSKSETCVLFICASSEEPTYSYSYEELRDQFRFMEEKQVVTVKFDETYSDERVAKIRDAFFQFFLNAMTQQATDQPPPPASDKEKEAMPNIRYGNGYTFKQENIKRVEEGRIPIFNLNYRLAVRWPVQVVGNLASWYDGVRDNPKCVASINLNDPFFQHRDINFILDLDAKDMFDDAVNYVTVNVRKKRSDGRPFEDRVTIDGKYVREKGVSASVTYARGEDKNPDAYEYQTRWSLKGGHEYPASPRWQQGAWEGVTLAPPIIARTIEVEGDLEGMRASEITRVTAQIRFYKFGQEMEDNIQLSAAADEALVAKRIYMDRDTRGYAYRLLVNHKTQGKLALPWSAKVGDNYIYASIPPELSQTPDPAFIETAKKAGQDAADAATTKVLDQFKAVLGGTQ